jgi:outer membrane protein, heavy metal efflux system
MLLVIALGAWLSGVFVPPQTPGAPPPGPSPVITLQDAIAKARAHSALVDAARARELAAAQAQDSVARLPNPFVEFRGENFSHVPTTVLPHDVFLTVSQPFELGGKHGARSGIEAALHAQATVEVTSAEWAVITEVVELYIEVLRARDVAATLVEQREGVGEIVSILAQRVQQGLSAEADLRKFETEQTRLSSQIARSSVSLQSVLLRLSSMVGEVLQPDQLTAPVVPAPARATPLSDADIANRVDVRAAAARLQRAEGVAALEHARGVPDLIVTAGYKRTAGYDTGVAAVTVPINVFERNRAAVAHAQGDINATRLELQLVRQRALVDAQARDASARQLADQASRIDRDLVTPAGIVRTAARSAFVEGRGDVLQLVDAERVYSDASREALELRLDATLAIIHARLARGENPLP